MKELKLEDKFKYDEVFTPTDLMRRIKKVFQVMAERRTVGIVQDNKITAVLVEASMYKKFLDCESRVESLENELAIVKAENGNWHSEEEINKILKKVNISPLGTSE